MEARELKQIVEGGGQVDESFAAQCKEKWAPLLEGVEDGYSAGVTAVLLENEMDHLKKLLSESTFASNAGEYTKFIFPVIRAVFPNLIATNICSVQPMNAPVGAIFFLKYKNENGVALGDFGGASNFDSTYSADVVDVTTAEDTGVNGAATAVQVSYTVAAVAAVPQFRSLVQGTVKVSDGTITGTDDGNGNMKNDSGGALMGTVNYATGVLSLNYLFTATATPDIEVLSYSYNKDVGDISEVNVDIEMSEVRAESRKLKAIWSSEAADDLKAFHGFDAESELVSGISTEIALELDREIVAAIETAAGHTGTTFDATAWSDTPSAYGYGHADYIRGIMKNLGVVSQAIYKSTFRSPANWMVTGPETLAYLDQLPEFVPTAGNEQHSLGAMKAGTLSGKYTVWTDPYRAVAGGTTQTTIIGYKGTSFMDAGYVYAPYVPLQVTPTFLDPGTFEFKKGMRTRYAKKLVNANYFGKIAVTIA